MIPSIFWGTGGSGISSLPAYFLMKSNLLSSISENSGPSLSKWISQRGCFFSKSAGVLLSLQSLTSSSWSPLIINLLLIQSMPMTITQTQNIYQYKMGQSCEHCCKMVESIDTDELSKINRIVERIETKKTLKANKGQVNHDKEIISLFDGFQIFHEPNVNLAVGAVLEEKMNLYRKPKNSIIQHVIIHQAYLDQFKYDQIYAENQSKIFMISLLEADPPAVIEQLPIYFKFKKTGAIYNGQWKHFKGVKVPHGLGRCFYSNNSYYEGLFREGIPHYFGLFITSTGQFYEGQIQMGQADGNGYFRSRQVQGNSVQYRGSFKNNQRNGQGEERAPNYHFIGIFKNGYKVSGSLKVNGTIYEGQFKNNRYHGKGKLTLPDSGGTYEGDFSDGLQEGFGQYSWPDGSFYKGNFKNGKREGYGQYFNAENKSTAIGIWKSGVIHGYGEYINMEDEKIRCIWSGNKITKIESIPED